MNAIYIIIVIAGISLQNIFKKAYNNKQNNGACIFSAIASIVAGLMFLVMGMGNFNLEQGMISYAIAFAISYAVSAVSSILAIANGSLALSSLVISYSLIIPTISGILFFDEEIGKWLVVGLILVCISLFLINMGNNDNVQSSKVTLKWIIYVFLAFLSNGMCSAIQTMQQDVFDGRGKNEFMCIALFIVSVCLAVVSFMREKKAIIPAIKGGAKYMIMCGIANGIVNLLVMVLSNTMNKSVMFPLVSAGGIIATAVVSIFFYKERLTVPQTAGLILGIGSVVFLNL